MKNEINLSEKFEKLSENLSITFCDNGFLVELNGENSSGDWLSRKLVLTGKEQLFSLIEQAANFPRT